MVDRLPVLYLSHGAPPLADDATWTRQLGAWGTGLPRPRRILIVSAHWEAAPITLSSTTGAPLLHDFWGFPQKYFEVTYDAPSAPDLARDIEALVATTGTGVRLDQERGLDHGAYVPLKEMYPEADIPVLQMSMPTLDPKELFVLGRKLAPLRDDGTLIVGSGFTTHNLQWFHPHDGPDYAPPTPSAEFDAWAEETMAAGDVDALIDFAHRAPAPDIAHPRTEHWAPLFMSLGAADSPEQSTSVIDGFWYGLSKRSWQLA